MVDFPRRGVRVSLRHTLVLFALVGNLVRHDVKVQRKETFLGLAWLLLWPVLQAGGFVLAFDFIRGARSDLTAVGSVYLGVLIWSTATAVFTTNLQILRSNRDMITQIIFPFYLLPVVDVVTRYLFFVAPLVLGSAIWLIAFGKGSVAPALIGILLLAIGFFLFLLALAWVASLLGVVLPDLGQALPPVLMLLLALSPVFHRDAAVNPAFINWINRLNPFAHWVGLYYDILSGAGALGAVALALVYGLVAFLAALSLVRFAYAELAKLL